MAEAVTGTTRDDEGRTGRAIDVGLLALLAVVLLAVFLGPTVRHEIGFPVGPDAPVYLWWARVGAALGIGAVGERPGVVALLPTTAGTLAIGLVPALAGLQYALGSAIGLAGAALVRGPRAVGRPVWLAGGFLAGVWATHLGGGYLANLAMAAPFVAAAAALTRRTRRGTIGAALLLAGGGLMHPQFLIIGGAVLLVTATWAAIRDRGTSTPTGDAGRVLVALGAGVGGVLIGIAATSIGAARIGGDTSKDAFLRRLGEWRELRSTYLDRFGESWRRYAPIMNTFLDVTGALYGRGFARRFLVSWLACTVAAVGAGVLTGWFPPDRILTFAFCVPLLASLGLAWLGRRLGRWWLAVPVCVVLVALTAWPTLRAWEDDRAFVSPSELRAATIAGRIAATTVAGTPIVVVVDDPDTPTLFLASHARNLVRAAVPPDRAGDVVVVVGTLDDVLAGRPTVTGDRLEDLASRTTVDEMNGRATAPAVFVLRDLDTRPGALDHAALTRWDTDIASTVGPARPLDTIDGELGGSTPTGIVDATIRSLLLLTLVGYGWARWSLGDTVGAAAAAPAFGAATLGIVALALERAGAGLGGSTTAIAAAALAGAGGYGLLVARHLADRRWRRRQGLLVERQADPDP
jgi:hypothetical protein